MARQAGEEPLGRHAPPRRDRARPGARAADLLSRRADHRPRSGLARRGVGDAAEDQAERDLTVLLTTHYMDEADKLCDRIAIVDHGELKALDSPLKLKASIPGKNVLEVELLRRAAGLDRALRALPDVETRHRRGPRRSASPSRNGPATTMALMEAAARPASRAVAVGPEHDARRRVRALHGPGAARRAAGGVGRRTAPS